ncbi:hypothetical protein ABE218_11810 [Bacillus smithii]|uniref:hypothetical protein n=1 Tax=Bacillus smithii TaxID=1479 RepID=UPI003D1BE3FD
MSTTAPISTKAVKERAARKLQRASASKKTGYVMSSTIKPVRIDKNDPLVKKIINSR